MISYGIDLDAPIYDGSRVRWINKKEFCESEARNYYDEGVGIEGNPYTENSPSYNWFNDEYIRILSEDVEIKLAFQAEVMSFIIKPPDEPVFSEMATIVTRIDEGAGEFVCIDQSGGGNGLGKINIAREEWDKIKWAVEELLHTAEK
jgi:hypothetical protein